MIVSEDTDNGKDILTIDAAYKTVKETQKYIYDAVDAFAMKGLELFEGKRPDKNDKAQVASILKLIKEQGVKKKDLTVHVPNATDNPKTLVGFDMTIAKNDYEKIHFKNFATVEPSYIDPTKYKTQISNDSDEIKWASIDFSAIVSVFTDNYIYLMKVF